MLPPALQMLEKSQFIKLYPHQAFPLYGMCFMIEVVEFKNSVNCKYFVSLTYCLTTIIDLLPELLSIVEKTHFIKFLK